MTTTNDNHHDNHQWQPPWWQLPHHNQRRWWVWVWQQERHARQSAQDTSFDVSWAIGTCFFCFYSTVLLLLTTLLGPILLLTTTTNKGWWPMIGQWPARGMTMAATSCKAKCPRHVVWHVLGHLYCFYSTVLLLLTTLLGPILLLTMMTDKGWWPMTGRWWQPHHVRRTTTCDRMMTAMSHETAKCYDFFELFLLFTCVNLMLHEVASCCLFLLWPCNYHALNMPEQHVHTCVYCMACTYI